MSVEHQPGVLQAGQDAEPGAAEAAPPVFTHGVFGLRLEQQRGGRRAAAAQQREVLQPLAAARQVGQAGVRGPPAAQQMQLTELGEQAHPAGIYMHFYTMNVLQDMLI